MMHMIDKKMSRCDMDDRQETLIGFDNKERKIL